MEAIIIVLVSVVIATIFVIKKEKLNRNKKAQQLGVEYIHQIKKIITSVQQHRGLTAGWLNGDTKVKTKLAVLKQSISQDIKKLAYTPVYQNERWAAFSDHWDRLLNLNSKSSITNSFDQHTMMIRNLAYLLEDTAENAYLTVDFLPKLTNIGYVWRELILATESIGQSRAIGVGIAVKHNCSSVDKIRLNFLIQTMAKTTAHTLQNLPCLSEQKTTHEELITEATDKMHKLMKVIEVQLINAEKININNSLYFDIATDAMTKMNDIFDHQLKQLQIVL